MGIREKNGGDGNINILLYTKDPTNLNGYDISEVGLDKHPINENPYCYIEFDKLKRDNFLG